MYRNGVKNYQRTDVITADPKRLVIMCYQGAIDNLHAAQKRHEAGEFEAKAKSVNKAQDFLNELMHSLDFEQGGEIAVNLDRLYNYMIRRIIHAEATRDIEPLSEVASLLEDLKEAWGEIFSGSKKHVFESHDPAPLASHSSGTRETLSSSRV